MYRGPSHTRAELIPPQTEDERIDATRPTNFIHDFSVAHDRSFATYEVDTTAETEQQFLSELTDYIINNPTDTNFSAFLRANAHRLPSVFQQMRGLEQHRVHGDYDPLEHTLNMIDLLETSTLTDDERVVARLTAIWHDIGKLIDAKSREHPKESVKIAETYLPYMGVDQDIEKRVLKQIELHDALGDVARTDGRSILNIEDLDEFFTDPSEFIIHKTIALADIKSIPGLAKYAPNIEAIYRLLERRIWSKLNWIDDTPTHPLPFEPVDLFESYRLVEDYRPEDRFDDLDSYYDDVERRKYNFERANEEAQEYVEKALIQLAYNNDPHLMPFLQSIGRELDRAYVVELEEKYGVPLERLRIAVEVFNITYRAWNLDNHLSIEKLGSRWEVAMDHMDFDWVRRELIELKKSAEMLSGYTVEATHMTTGENAQAIDQVSSLYKSDSRDNEHWEGDGVYLGILGGYRNWDEMMGIDDPVTYVHKVPLADCLPIVHAFMYPRAMSVTSGELLDMQAWNDKKEEFAVVHGLKQFRQDTKMRSVEVLDWKVRLLEELLGARADVVLDEFGDKTVVMDTDEDPIVWMGLCRALRIRRFIPISELRRSNLPPEVLEAYGVTIHSVEQTDEAEQNLPLINRLRGISRRDLEVM